MARTTDDRVRLTLDPLEARDVPAVVGGLDPSFGTGGKVVALSGVASGGDVAVDSLGRVVVAGNTGTGAAEDFLVTRFNPDGSPDTTFGTGGKVQVDFGANALDEARAVKIDANNNVVVAGLSLAGGTSNMAFVRLLAATGAPDPSFGGGGTGTKLVPQAVGGNGANDLAFDAAGNVVAIGSEPVAGDTDFEVVRLLANGSALDPAFNGGAAVTVGVTAKSTEFGNGVAIDPTGAIVGTGTSLPSGGTTFQFAAFRLLAAGTLDPAFNAGKVLVFNRTAATSDEAFSVTTDGTNAVYLSGISNDGAGTVAGAVIKLTPGGVLDPTFGTAGIAATEAGNGTGSATQASDLQVLPGGRVLVAGSTRATAGATRDFFVSRLLPTGLPDPSFNPTGAAPGLNVFGFGTNTDDQLGDPNSLHGMAVTAEGRVVVAGRDAGAAGGSVEVARLIGSVEKDTELAVGGTTNGTATVFTPNFTSGQVVTTPAFTANPFGGFTGNVRVATGDVNGDGIEDLILVTGPGGTGGARFAVVSGADQKTLLIAPTDPFGNATFTGGAFVSAGDFNNDGRAEIVVTPDQGGGPNVVIYDLVGTTATVMKSFLGINDPAFRGGARTAIGDFNGDGVADLVVAAGFLGGPRVSLYDGKTVLGTGNPTNLVNDFFAFGGTDAETLRNGVFVAAGDINGDGFADLIAGGGPGGGPRVLAISGKTLTDTSASGGSTAAQAAPLMNFFVNGDQNSRGGVRLAATDLDGDGKADVAAASGEGLPSNVRVYLGKNITSTAEPGTVQSFDPYGQTLPGGVFVG